MSVWCPPDGLTAAAIKHVDGAILARTTFDRRRKAHFEADKRMSLERQAASMVREICPELRLEVPGETWELGGRRIVRITEVHEGKAAIRDVERLLARIWQEELLVTEKDSHFAVKAPGDTIVARLRCERNKDSAEYFQVVFSMRNRDAHPDDPRQRDEWNRIQKFVAKLSGRRWSPSKQPKSPNQLFQPDDLQLTSLEGTEVKLLILRGICDGLEKLHPPNDAK